MLRTRKEEKGRKSKEWSENATCRRLILTRLSKKKKKMGDEKRFSCYKRIGLILEEKIISVMLGNHT